MSTLLKGTVICATSICTGTPFNITVTSSEPVARGSTAYIFVGDAGETDSLNTGRKPLALKVFSNVWAVSGGVRNSQEQLLRRELRAAYRVKHPHILTFTGLAITDFHTILISPLMRNGDLIQYLRERHNVDRNELVLQLAQAVEHLHTEHRIIHGDLKCENVLVSDDGRVLLADFGLSTFMDKTESHTSTATGVRSRYTAQFAAPELLACDGSPSELPSKTCETDVYAFGMTVLQVFTGQPPWPGYGFQAIVREVSSGNIHPRPGREITRAGLVDAWWEICRNCWKFNPRQRPPMHRVLDELSRSYRTMRIARTLTQSIMRGPINDDSSKLRVNILEALWSSDYGQKWLGTYGMMLFNELGRRLRQQQAHGDDAGFNLLQAELRLLDNSFVYGSIDTANAIANTMVPLSHILGTSELDTYQTFPTALHSDAQEIYSVAFLSPTIVVAGSSSNSLQIWDIETGEPIGMPLIGHTDRVSCVAVSPSGMLIASCSLDRTIRLWKWDAATRSGDSKGRILGHRAAPVDIGRAWSVAFSPDGSNLVSGGDDESVRVWNITTGHHITRAVHKHGAVVHSVAFSPNGRWVLSSAQDRIVRLWHWDRNSGTLRAAKNHLHGHQRGVNSVSCSPDGSVIASGSLDHTVRVWNADSGQLKYALHGHTYRVLSVAFSPNSQHLASASQDRTVRIWDARTGEVLGVLRAHDEPVHSVAFSPDGTRVVSGSGDGSVRVWDRIQCCAAS